MSAAISNKPVIQLRDLAKTYQTGEVEVKAVRGITLDIDRGDFVAIMGASGSGKSTMMKIVAGMERRDAGRMLWQGREVSFRAPAEAAAPATAPAQPAPEPVAPVPPPAPAARKS